jgi:hypothetical protein
MNLLLRAHENVNDPVWSVIISVMIAVALALGYVIYILKISYTELNDGTNDTTEQEELLQLPSDGDQS